MGPIKANPMQLCSFTLRAREAIAPFRNKEETQMPVFTLNKDGTKAASSV